MGNVTGITFEDPKREASSFAFQPRSYPEYPGCYLFLDSDDALLYVGKAKNLRRRLASYFRNGHRPHRKSEMITRICGIELILCRNEREALVLECNLIRHHHPPYNGKLSREGEGYFYIARTDEEFPRFVPYRRDRVNYALENAEGHYAELFGPFTEWNLRNRLLEVLRSRFLLRTCHELPRKACARAQTGACGAPCTGAIDARAYRATVNEASRLLRHPPRRLLQQIRHDMAQCADQQDYNRARELRDRLRALEHAALPQVMESDRDEDLDVVWAEGDIATCLAVRDGRVLELRTAAVNALSPRGREATRGGTYVVGNEAARMYFGSPQMEVPRTARSRHGALLEICRLNHRYRVSGVASLAEEAS
jgi:excinuclease ABC subunit C